MKPKYDSLREYLPEYLHQFQKTLYIVCGDVFQHMESNNSAQVQQHFTEAKREVDAFREQVAAKNAEIADINRQMENVGKGPQSSGVAM